MITVNKLHTLEWREGLTVRDVLRALNYTYTHIFVVINEQVVRHDAYDTTPIPDEADVRVVHLIAGG